MLDSRRDLGKSLVNDQGGRDPMNPGRYGQQQAAGTLVARVIGIHAG